jgi:psiF repeat-containing protein
MKRSIWVVTLSAALAAATLAQPALADNTQQTKMTTCNADAKTKGLTGDDRKAYMKTCLSAAGASADSKPLNSQQQKMKSCNADAKTKGLTGDDRKAYMSTCLKGGPASQ